MKLDCQEAYILWFVVKLYFMSWFLTLSRRLEVPDWGCITWKVFGYLQKVHMYLGLKFQPSGMNLKGVMNPLVIYIINAWVISCVSLKYHLERSSFKFHQARVSGSWDINIFSYIVPYVIIPEVVKDTRSSWLELNNLKSMWMT